MTGDVAVARVLDAVERLPAVWRRLARIEDVDGVLAASAELAREACDFDRAILLAVRGGGLAATGGAMLAHDASDRLRRRAASQELELRPGTQEDLVLRAADAPHDAAPSALAAALGLREHAFAAVRVDDVPLALLVLDRAAPVDREARARVRVFAVAIAVAVHDAVLRARLDELASEMRHLTVSAQALIQEVVNAPVALPGGSTRRPAFPLSGVDARSPDAGEGTVPDLSPREHTIAELLARGLSNRAIAEQLFLAPDTVKANVARVMRKLGASNRVEVATRWLRLTAADAPGGRPDDAPGSTRSGLSLPTPQQAG